MRTLTDIHKLLLKEQYPNLHADSDPDIERYFEMRKAGRQADALNLYNSALRTRYPDDRERARLLGYYRSRDPRYQLMLRECLVLLADRMIARAKRIIDIMVADILILDMRDAYSVIKHAERLLSLLDPDRYEAVSFCERHARLARLLSHRGEEMERTAELLRLYVTDTLDSVQDLIKQHEERKRAQAARQYAQAHNRTGFDLSHIVFSQEDVKRIRIPETITRVEDIVIAYCLKYWNHTSDPAFEKTIVLYGKKYKTRHGDIFLAIKNGRDHGWKDEEILNAVLSNVVTGYYYSISGDVYLQRTWAKYKMTIADNNTTIPGQVEEPQRAVPPPSKKTRRKIKSVANSLPSPQPRQKTGEATKKRIQQTPRLPGTNQTLVPNSIADIIRKHTGKTYTVYKDLFFKHIRPAIRTVLSTSSDKKSGLFTGKQNEAEEIVYDFLYTHYNNPYQNWGESEERDKLEELGYRIIDIEPIITRWINDNK